MSNSIQNWCAIAYTCILLTRQTNYSNAEYIPRMEFAYTLILGDVKDLPITDFLYPEG
jgi:hypothetical protein